jgi:hypothetical protein
VLGNFSDRKSFLSPFRPGEVRIKDLAAVLDAPEKSRE